MADAFEKAIERALWRAAELGSTSYFDAQLPVHPSLDGYTVIEGDVRTMIQTEETR